MSTIVRSRAVCRAAVRQRLTGSVTRDPRTGMVRRGTIVVTGGRVVLTLPKRLEPPNVWLWTHWRTKVHAKLAWKTLITRTACEQLGRATIADIEAPASALGWTVPSGRLLVDIERHVIRGRGITDPDNLAFVGKGLVDCLVQTGFLVDDSTDHIDLRVSQVPSTNGLDLTVVTIAPIPVAPGVPSWLASRTSRRSARI